MTHGTYEESDWSQAQRRVKSWLLHSGGIRATSAGYFDPYDLKTSTGKRIEVKFCPFQESGRGWRFNIHRHGKLDESQVDFYILRFEPGISENVLGKNAFHLVIPAPLKRKTVWVTVRSLVCGSWREHFNNFKLLSEGE